MAELENANDINEIQLATQRKIKVNAQVTFVLWLIETLISTGITACMFLGALGPTTFTLNMLLFLIILPYSHLQNTSSNKSRIVEDGWVNVLKNLVPCRSTDNGNNVIRLYVISSDPVAGSSDSHNGTDGMIGRTINNKSHETSNHKPRPQFQEEDAEDTAGKIEHQTGQTEQVVLNCTKLN